ncbi:MAG: hypothetical protein ACYDBB_07230 [Armatimonadota bacterium]
MMQKHHSPFPKVILLGGAPMVGKSTIARKLAARLAYGCLSTDDLGQASGTVTTAQEYPAFHYMDGIDYREYYVSRSVENLIADAARNHTAIWPGISRVITAHATWGDPVVIEGWALSPLRVAELDAPHVVSLWLIASDAVLESRVRAATDFYGGASDEAAMIRHYVALSEWYNQRIREEAASVGLPIIQVTIHSSPDLIQVQCRHIVEGKGG